MFIINVINLIKKTKHRELYIFVNRQKFSFKLFAAFFIKIMQKLLFGIFSKNIQFIQL